MQRRQFIRGSLSVAAASVIPASVAQSAAPRSVVADDFPSPLTLLHQLSSELRHSPLSRRSPSVFSESHALTMEVLQRLEAARPVAASLWQNLADSIDRLRQHDGSVDPNQRLQPLAARQISLLSR